MSGATSLEDPVLKESRGAVRILTLNRPTKLNAADLEMQQMLLAYVKEAASDKEVRALILTGAGRAFSAGGDRSLVEALTAGRLTQKEELGRIHVDTIRSMLGLSIPTIAAVRGPAVGYAAGLVALCDLVVMSEDAFLCDPHVKFGVAATTAAQVIWPRLTSYAVAKEILMTGRQVGAQEAQRLGLANRVVPTGQELPTALELADIFVNLPANGVAETKRAFNRVLLEEVEAALREGPAG